MPALARDDVRLHYEDEGEGFPVILHTGGAGSSAMWKDGGYVDRLAGFRLLSIDHRGRGRSDRPSGLAAHDVTQYVSDVLALADHAGLARYAFIGYSFGGFVGLEVAMRDPRLVALVTLGTVFEPADAVPDASRYDDPVKTAGMEGLLQAIAHDEGIELPAWLARDFLATDPVQFALTMDANADHPDPWHELGRIGAQTVLIAGGLEDPDGMQDRMAAAMPEASSVHIDGVGHVGGFLRPDDVVAAALPLLRAGQSGTVG